MNSDIPLAKVYYDDIMPYIRVQHNKKQYLDIYEIEKTVKKLSKYSTSNNNTQ